MSNIEPASRSGNGRKLRRARNVVKKWQAELTRLSTSQALRMAAADYNYMAIAGHIRAKRYERACALILAAKLSQ